MAKPLSTAKQSVELASGGVRVSKIRRDPPPATKQTVIPDRDERDERSVIFGVLAFTLAIMVIIIGLSAYNGWTPRQYTAHF
jgi:hypothetical protein